MRALPVGLAASLFLLGCGELPAQREDAVLASLIFPADFKPVIPGTGLLCRTAE
jgi:hypothetical protein